MEVRGADRTADNADNLPAGTVHSTMPTVWVCMAVFNRIGYTRKCLEYLNDQTYPGIQTVVVDDGSTDGTSDMVSTFYPETILLRGDGTLYWTGAMHLGITHILEHCEDHDYVLLLNDDLVFSQDLVERLLDIAKCHPRSLVQAVESCVDNQSLIWQGGAEINWWTAKHRLLNYHRSIHDFKPGYCQESAYLTGRGVLVPIEVFRSAGNFDKSYQQNGDPEFTRRAAKAGYALLVAYGVPVFSYSKGDNINETDCYLLTDLRKYYFGVLSMARLSTRWKDAMSMTNSRFQGAVFFAFSVIRTTGHFCRRLHLRREE